LIKCFICLQWLRLKMNQCTRNRLSHRDSENAINYQPPYIAKALRVSRSLWFKQFCGNWIQTEQPLGNLWPCFRYMMRRCVTSRFCFATVWLRWISTPHFDANYSHFKILWRCPDSEPHGREPAALLGRLFTVTSKEWGIRLLSNPVLNPRRSAPVPDDIIGPRNRETAAFGKLLINKQILCSVSSGDR